MSNDYIDPYTLKQKSITAPWNDGQIVVPDTPFSNGSVCRGIILTVAGTIEFRKKDGTTLVLPPLVAGVVHACRTTEIVGAGTTATGIVAVW